MQLLAGKTVFRQGFSRYGCSNRRPLLALTHRLCPDSRQTALSNCRHYSPVNRRGRIRLHGQRPIQLAMGAKSAAVLGGLQRKITSRLIKKRPLAKRGEAKVVNPVARIPPNLLRVAASSNSRYNNVMECCRRLAAVRTMRRRGRAVPCSWEAKGGLRCE